MSFKIFMPQKIKQPGIDILEQNGYEIVSGNGLTEDDLARDIVGCDAAIIRTVKITEKILNAADKLKIIARHGAGYDGIDVEVAKKKNILIVNAPGANSTSVAELAIFYMLYCSRNFKVVEDNFLKDYQFAKMGVEKHELCGKTLGLIGTGNIGNKVAKIAINGFGMKVIAFDPFAKPNEADEILYLSREEVFKKADYVSLHVPLTNETRNSVSDTEFEEMKTTAYLINTSRGAVVDEEALYKAIKEKKIAGAALDTVSVEPIKSDNHLLELENVLIAPHIGGATEEASDRSSIMCAEGIVDFLQGKQPNNIIREMRNL